MKTLLIFILALFAMSGWAQPALRRQALTTNSADFVSPASGQIPKIHSVAGGVIVWTNAADGGGGNLVENNWDTNAFPGGTGEGSLLGFGRALTNTGIYSLVTGSSNLSQGPYNVIAGGSLNIIIGGDPTNAVSVIGGGENNQIRFGNNKHSAILSGQSNIIQNGRYSLISGGWVNEIGPGMSASNVTIAGGFKNRVNAWNSTISGGYTNVIEEIANDFVANTIAGGGFNYIKGSYSVICGGSQNIITNKTPADLTDGEGCFIGGGRGNYVGGFKNAIAGGNFNIITNTAFNSYIGGGQNNQIASFGSMIGGGTDNKIVTDSEFSSISGGAANYVGTIAPRSSILGYGNRVNDFVADSHIFGKNITNTLDDIDAGSIVALGMHDTTKLVVALAEVHARSLLKAGAGLIVTNGLTNYNAFRVSEISAPGTPAANTLVFYAKDSGGVSRLFYKGDNGTEYGPLDAGSGTPGGSTTQVQYNNGGSFDGASGFVIPASEGETNANLSGTLRAYSVLASNTVTVAGGAAGVLELGDTDNSHHVRFTPNGTTTANQHYVYPAAGASGFLEWTFSNSTNLAGAFVAGSGSGSVLKQSGAATIGFAVPNAAADAALANAGEIHLNTIDEQISVHSAADGEISGEVALPLVQTKAWTFDPKAVSDGAVDRLFLMWIQDDAPEGIIIDEWKISFEADPTTEAVLDLKYADAMIGVANPIVVDSLNTTAGTATEDTDANINSGNAIPNGKVLYLEFGTAYSEANHQIMFQIWYHVEED